MACWLVDSCYSRVFTSDRSLYCGLYAWSPPGPDDRIYGGVYMAYTVYTHIV